MDIINARNVNHALPAGLHLLQSGGVRRGSRAGDVLVNQGPVVTIYDRPCERVMFHPLRDANPFFHFYEALWMLAGRNDIAALTPFVKRMQQFSDDGVTQHGAYGHRWRVHFGFDQLGHIIETLRENPEDRRCVLAMWDAAVDLGRVGKDLPCNTHVYFTRNEDGELDMTVCCRSNDIVWGAYGANAVHFSMLQEYVASAIGCSVGRYWQISNNYHGYLDTMEPLYPVIDELADPYTDTNYHGEPLVKPFPLMSTHVIEWQQDLEIMMREGGAIGLRDPFFRRVAMPILRAHDAYRDKRDPRRFEIALECIEQCLALDWRLACREWLERRERSATEANAQDN